MTLSIVIPAYREAARLGPTLDELAGYVDGRGLEIELIVVDDGSHDATAEVATEHLPKFASGKVLVSPANRGKGHAVRTGMLAATAERRLFMDADGSTRLDEISRFLDHQDRTGDDIVIASIGVRSARVTRPQPGLRRPAGRLSNLLIQGLVTPGIWDTQRGFKLFTARACSEVFSRCTIDGWLFDVEAIAIARRLGYRVTELGVTWEHREDSRVHASSYPATMRDLLLIRWRLWRRFYDLDQHHPDV